MIDPTRTYEGFMHKIEELEAATTDEKKLKVQIFKADCLAHLLLVEMIKGFEMQVGGKRLNIKRWTGFMINAYRVHEIGCRGIAAVGTIARSQEKEYYSTKDILHVGIIASLWSYYHTTH